MTLKHEDYLEFLNAHLHLLYFCHLQLTGKNNSFENFKNQPIEVKGNARNYFYDHFSMLYRFIEKSKDIDVKQKEILTGFKSKISGDFVVLKQLKNGAIFIDSKTEKVYSVFALSDPFTYLFDSFPVLVRTTILPYKDKIIYDGFFYLLAYIGPGIESNMNDIYFDAKENRKIIKSLN